MPARSPPRISTVMVPELLQSFPAPPSFIPPSPRTPMHSQPTSNPSTSSSIPPNPPPTLPPTGPLPPLPAGPSPITEEETLLFLSSASRLKRLSKLSINSTSSRRDSTATTTSMNSNGSTNGGVPGLSPSMSGSSISSSSSSSTSSSSARIRTESLTSSHSLRSYPSTSSLSVLSASASHTHRLPISVEKSPPARLLPPMEISITEEDDGISTSADLTAVTLDFLCSDMDEENGLPQFPILPRSPQPQQARKSKKSSPPPSSFKSPPPVTSSPFPLSFPNKEGDSPRGRTSPDIQTIISETPKPRRRKSSLLSNSSSRERTKSGAPPPLNRQPQRSSAPSAILSHTPSLRPSVTRKLSLPVGGHHEGVSDPEMDEIDMDRLERELEGDGTESDSSLDLHTPFAHVMLRDGLISPRSKVIAALDTSIRPGSTMSTASLKTKTGLFKDDRDTLKRRRRHRDGKLLRGGIGLTTGLGWSDSEDEDSPSPLTRRLSSMAISRTPSVASMRSQSAAGPSPLSRTHSTVSADGIWTRQSSTRSSTFSNSSSSSMRLPPTRETEDTGPPPLPPKDNPMTKSLPTRRPQPVTPSTPGPRTLKAKPSLKSIPSTSEFGVVERTPLTPSSSSGPRPLKLATSSSMLRSTSLGNSPGSRLANGSSMSTPSVNPAGSLDSRNRTRSVPSSTTVSPSPLLKNSKSLPRPVPVPTSSIPHVSSPLLDPSRQRSRIGTGMIYKKSGPITSEFGVASGLKRPTLTTSGLGGVRNQRLGVPSPLRTGGSSEGSSPSSSVEFGIAL